MSTSKMAALRGYASYRHFHITSPSEYVAHVEINRPDKLNAFKEDMWLELGRVFGQLSHDPDIRSVIFSGAGDRAFTTGLDIHAASQGPLVQDGGPADVARKATRLRRFIAQFQDSVSAIETCEKRMLFPSTQRENRLRLKRDSGA